MGRVMINYRKILYNVIYVTADPRLKHRDQPAGGKENEKWGTHG